MPFFDGHELFVFALFDDFPFLEDHDHVGGADGGEAEEEGGREGGEGGEKGREEG